jgi:hypothetical protein
VPCCQSESHYGALQQRKGRQNLVVV